MPNDIGVLTHIYIYFTSIISGGLVRTTGNAEWLLFTLIKIEVIVFCLWWALGKEDIATIILKKIVVISILIWIISKYPYLLNILKNTAINWGIKLGSNNLNHVTSFIENPSMIARVGLDLTIEIWKEIDSISFYKLGNIWELEIAGFVILFCYFVLAIQMLLALIEFYFISFASLILIPFTVFKPTSFIGEGVVQTILGLSIKLLLLATIISLGIPLVSEMTIPASPKFFECLGVMLTSMTLLFLAWQVPHMAMGMLSGRPSLTAESAAGVAVGASRGVARAGRGAISAVRGSASMGGRVARGSRATVNYAQGKGSIKDIASAFRSRQR